MKSKEIVILGSTGSIGTQTLEVVRSNEDMNVRAIAAGSNVDLLESQVREFNPEMVCVFDEEKALELKKRISNVKTEVVSGMEGLIECATLDSADIVVAAVVGMIGIRPVIEAIKAGKDIAFANKETLVTAGHIIMPMVKKYGVKMLPVDSEHAAIFQCLNGENSGEVDSLLLTASGGPFRGMTREQLEDIQVEDALKHPNWSMGRKITIDSSTMVNKGLEVIEAKWLFDVSFDQIKVIIQPQSVIHSMVQFKDGAVMAQLGTPDMRLPIQYALCYPERRILNSQKLDFYELTQITFEKPDMDTFMGLPYAYEAAKKGGNMPTVFNAANELAVSKFLNESIRYLDIYDIIRYAMDNVRYIDNPNVEHILTTEKETYELIESRW